MDQMKTSITPIDTLDAARVAPAKVWTVRTRLGRNLLWFLMVLGPGLIVMEADNDAGAVSTYTQAGAQYGTHLLWLLFLLLPVTYRPPPLKAPVFQVWGRKRRSFFGAGGADISTCVLLMRKRWVVLLHAFNRRVFRLVLWRRARGKNAPVFPSRAMLDISCLEQCSLVCMNRTSGVGRHTGAIPEAPGAGAIGSRH